MSAAAVDTAAGRVALLDHPVDMRLDAAEPVRPIAAETAEQHRRRLGTLPRLDAQALCALADDARLTGRGGAHFPASRKWQAYLAGPGGGLLVGNGAESEPASAKDAAVLQCCPHLVLDGLAVLASSLGIEECVLWLHDSAVASRRAVLRALAERPAGEPAVRLAGAPPGYLSGESSAIARALAGGPALPRFRRTPGATGSPPVLVHNVETLARIGLLARGLPSGSYLVTVAHPAGRTVLEVDRWQLLTDVLGAGGFDGAVGAVLVGGYGGRWLAGTELTGLRCDPESTPLGAGVLLPIGPAECGLARAADIAGYLAAASARQCGPCRLGLPAIAEALAALAGRRPRGSHAVDLRRFLSEVAGRGACGHPDGVVAMVSSALAVFAEDVRSHLDRGRCRHAG